MRLPAMSDVDFMLYSYAGEVAAFYGADVHCSMNIIPVVFTQHGLRY